jgi:hypothetical protein
MLQPIDDRNLGQALQILSQGGGREFWRRGLERARNSVSPGTGWPLGYLLRQDDQLAGIILTFASRRPAWHGTAPIVVNLSSWYVAPRWRGAALFMLMQLLLGSKHTFTDLTPSKDVVRICRSLKFTEWNEGLLLTTWPQTLALPRQRPRSIVVPFREVPKDALDEPSSLLLEDHERLGCLAAALWNGEGWQPLIFLSGRLLRVPCGYLIYATSRREILPHLRAIAAFLLSRGLPLLCMDADKAECPTGTIFLRQRRKFFKGPMPRDRIDYAYSELVYLNLWS